MNLASLLFREEPMPTYNIKQNCKVYIVRGSSRYKLEVYPDLGFSQTFEEKAQNVKTLHDQFAMFEKAIINKANPADFNFTCLLVKGQDFQVIGDWLTQQANVTSDESLYSYDVYVDTGVHIFKITKGVLTRATFQIQKEAVITVSIQGTASKLERFGPTGTTIPGTLVARDAVHEGIIPRRLLIEKDSIVVDNIVGVSVELVNNVQWVEYDTLHKSLYVTSPSETQVPEVFVVSSKVLSGTVQKYLTEDASDVQGWSTNSTLRIRVGDESSYFLDINIPQVVYTTNVGTENVFTQTYSFRMTHSPSNIADVINY